MNLSRHLKWKSKLVLLNLSRKRTDVATDANESGVALRAFLSLNRNLQIHASHVFHLLCVPKIFN